MRAGAIGLALTLLGCAKAQVPPSNSPAPVERGPAASAEQFTETLPVNVGQFVALRGGTRIYVQPNPEADWVSTFTAGDAHDPKLPHAYTVARVLAKEDGMLGVALLDQDFHLHCVSPNVLSGVIGFVEADAVMEVATKSVPLEQDGPPYCTASRPMFCTPSTTACSCRIDWSTSEAATCPRPTPFA